MKSPETLTHGEAEKLLIELRKDEHERVKGWKCVRNHCMAVIMLDAGLRVGEMSKLRIEDLIFQGRPAMSIDMSRSIAEKGCNRIVPTTNRIREALTDMYLRVWKKYDQTPLVYAFHDAKPWRPITERQVQRIISAAAKASFNRHINPHVLRHTFATRLMKITSVRVVQELLGHKHITSTQIYTHPAADDMQGAIDLLNSSLPQK